MKTKLVAMLLLATTIFSCKKDEIQPKQCWNFSSKVILEYEGNCFSLNPDTLQGQDTTICNLTEIEAEYVRDTTQSSIKGSYPWYPGCMVNVRGITTKKVVK